MTENNMLRDSQTLLQQKIDEIYENNILISKKKKSDTNNQEEEEEKAQHKVMNNI